MECGRHTAGKQEAPAALSVPTPGSLARGSRSLYAVNSGDATFAARAASVALGVKQVVCATAGAGQE